MAFIDNSGDIILDAVLTDLGRQRMARGDGSFRIKKFALSDDEINYGLWNANDQTDIQSSPILEAITNNSSTLKSFLVTYPTDNLLYLPVMKINEKRKETETASGLASGNGMFHIATNESTKTSLASIINTPGYIDGSPAAIGEHKNYIRIDQGIDNQARPFTTPLPAELTETSYEIMVDSRFLTLHTRKRTPARVNYTDDDGFDYYYVNLSDKNQFVSNNTSGTSASSGNATDDQSEVIEGQKGTTLEFSLGASFNVADSDYFFDLLGGGTTTINSVSGYKYIDTNVRAKGMTTGYTIDIPVRVIRK